MTAAISNWLGDSHAELDARADLRTCARQASHLAPEFVVLLRGRTAKLRHREGVGAHRVMEEKCDQSLLEPLQACRLGSAE